jgi:D-3-phosphoglycerate dehydrogenase
MKVMVCDKLADDAIKIMKDAGLEVDVKIGQTEEEVAKNIKGYHAVIVRSATKIRKPAIEAADVLKVIARGGIGLDNIDVADAKAKGIQVINTPEASTRSVAELAIGLMFALARFIPQADASMKKGQWEKKAFEGSELAGKTLGIIGTGRIGKETARIANLLGMTVIGWDKVVKTVDVNYLKLVEFDELLTKSDLISLHIPLDKTAGATLKDDEFAKMKQGVFLVNCARGGVVDEKALLDALNSGKVAKAAVDVYAKEPTDNMTLINHPNVICTPHLGASSKEGQKRVGKEVAEKIVAALK